MKLQHLIEDKHALTDAWQGKAFDTIQFWLKTHGDMEALSHYHTAANVLMKAVTRYSLSDPYKLYKVVPTLIKLHRDAMSASLREALLDLLEAVVRATLKEGDAALSELFAAIGSPADLHDVIPSMQHKQLMLAYNRLSRTKEQEKFDAENDLFIFIGRPTFKEDPPGSDNFKKSLEIENMVKVDRFDPKAHEMAHMMKLRARMQGQDSEVYLIELPKGTFEGGVPEDWLLDTIIKHKRKA